MEKSGFLSSRWALRALFLPQIFLGCFGNEAERFTCGEPGITLNSGSNWVYLDTTSGFHLATKYPIAYKLEIVDANLRQMNASSDSIDSVKWTSLPRSDNGFRKLHVYILPIDRNGSDFKDGCYKGRFHVKTLEPNLADGDIPNDVNETIRMEWLFRYESD